MTYAARLLIASPPAMKTIDPVLAPAESEIIARSTGRSYRSATHAKQSVCPGLS